MTYSFTEKKRIRKSFAKRAAVLDVPFLLATQINSYAEFLQAEVAADKRREEIARMLAGAEITEEARAAADRLIKAAG